MDRELRRGTLEMVLLRLLEEDDRYGYELITALDERSGGAIVVKDGTLYAVLYRLEASGWVEPYWRTQERGVPRKYYRITEAGREKLERSLDDWFTYVDAVGRIVGTRKGKR